MKKILIFLLLSTFLFLTSCSLFEKDNLVLESRINIQEKIIKELKEELKRLKAEYDFKIKEQAEELEKMKELIHLLEKKQNRAFDLAKKKLRPFIPENVIFCGEKVPLDKFEVKERLERALRFEMNRWAMVLIFLRSGRWFPLFEEKIKKLGLPDDLKYVAAIESDLNPEAYSSAGAVGFWQITKSTGKKIMRLKIDSYVDERLDPQKATEAALEHLKDLYQRFGGWPSALAGYNMNPDTYAEIKAKEKASDFYGLKSIPLQTRNYPFRAIAVKLIMENPERYGFPSLEEINKIKFKPYPLEVKIVTVYYSKEKIADIASRLGMTSYEFRTFNPHLAPLDRTGKMKKDYLRRGKYRVYVKKRP